MTTQHKHFDWAHFNPHELEVMDKWQGGRTDIPGTKIRIYPHLEDMMHKPEIEVMFKREYEKHAKGGQIGDMLRVADMMRRKGRNGDCETAIVGPKTIEVLNRYAGGGSINPTTKKYEFFNLGGMFKGIGNAIGHVTKPLAHMASGALGGIGHTIGSAANGLGMRGVGNAINGVTNFAQNAVGKVLPGAIVGGLEGGPMGALAGGATDFLANGGFNGMGGHRGGGAGPIQAPSSLGGLGQQFMNSSFGQKALSGAKGLMGQANNLYSQAAANPYAQSALAAYNAHQQATNPGAAPIQMPGSLQDIGNQFANSQYGQQLQQQGQNLYNQANQQYQGMAQQFNDMQQPSEGPSMMDQVMSNPYAQAATAGYQAYQNARGGGNAGQNSYGGAGGGNGNSLYDNYSNNSYNSNGYNG